MTIEIVVGIVDRAEVYAMQHEPELQRVDRLERRRRIAEAAFRCLRWREQPDDDH